MILQTSVEDVLRRVWRPEALVAPIHWQDLPTPALVLERTALQNNIKHMADFLGPLSKGFRPHAKTHKSAQLAHLQIEAGAVGICVAKISEALTMAAAGIPAILVTSPLTTAAKVEVALYICRQFNTQLDLVVDSHAGLELILNQSAANEQMPGIVLDLDVAMGRTGIRDDGLLNELVERVIASDCLSLKGFQHYAGHLMHIEDFAERAEKSANLWQKVEARVRSVTERFQLSLDELIITGCGTGTYNIDCHQALITDLQVGSYVFMDEEYRLIHGEDSDRFEDFDSALTVACTTISSPTGKTITVDGGYKAFASDSVAPVSDELAGVKFHFAGDEHGVLVRPPGEQTLELGQVHRFVVPHCDPTVNLHDYYWVVDEDGYVRERWPVNARGCSW